MPSKKLQNIDVSSIGKETLQMRNIELEVYTWKRHRQKIQGPFLILDTNQSLTPGTGAKDNISIPSSILEPILAPVPIVLSDLDVPIAPRKGTCTCSKYPIVEYLSYEKLSRHHKAFTSNFSNIFVPRRIQEALNDSN